MGGHKTISASSYKLQPVPLVADYNVSGVLLPDVTGDFFDAGIHDGKPYYRNSDSSVHLWWYGDESLWIISTGVGVMWEFYWAKTGTVAGVYSILFGCTGIATVNAGPA